MNIRSLLARRVGGLKPSSIRALNPLMRLPGMISLGGGYPNAQTFAISSLEVVFKSGRRFTIRDRAMDLACQYGPTDAHVGETAMPFWRPLASICFPESGSPSECDP